MLVPNAARGGCPPLRGAANLQLDVSALGLFEAIIPPCLFVESGTAGLTTDVSLPKPA